jgi:hypothetical protein
VIRLFALALVLSLNGPLVSPPRASSEQNEPSAQNESISAADSLVLLAQAKDVQARYERFREQRMPPQLADLTRRCDDMVGRYCFRFPDHLDVDDWRAPEPSVELELGRTRLLSDLADIAAKIPGDLWILGQRVYYLTDMGAWANAANVARRCGGGTHWWCTALSGYVHHESGLWTVADEAFQRALQEMPPDTAALWTAPEYLFDESVRDIYAGADGRESLEEHIWLLSDPLYLVEGNDRKTEHFARQVLVRLGAEAVNGTGLEWQDDLEEITIRWGAPEGWSRERDVPKGDTMTDSRRMVSHRRGQEFFPPVEALADPSLLAPGGWTLGERARLELREGGPPVDPLASSGLLAALTQSTSPTGGTVDLNGIIRDGVARSGPWTGYTAPYATDIDVLDTQVARFRRGDSLLVVGAYAPGPKQPRDFTAGPPPPPRRPAGRDVRAERDVSRSDTQARRNPFGRVEEEPIPFMPEARDGNVESGLFLVDTESGDAHEVRGDGPEGALKLQLPNGHYVVGVEAFNPRTKRAWRDRYGLWQDPIVPGLAAISDLLILRGGGEIPTSLDEALPAALPAVRIEAGQAFKLAWELYGLRPGEMARVRIGVDRGTGLLGQVGEFLRLLEPDEPVVMTFEDAGPDVPGTVFRAVELNLPDLEPGEYRLSVEIELEGREPMTVGRLIRILPAVEP